MSDDGPDVVEWQSSQADGDMARRLVLAEALLQAIPDFVFVYNIREHRYVHSNRSLSDFLGYPRHEVAGLSAVEFAASVGDPDDADEHADHMRMQRQLVPGERIERRLQLRMGDGSYHWFKHSVLGFSFDEHGPVEVLGTLHDISSLVDAATRVTDSERRFRELFHRSPAGTIVIDDAGTILEANQAMADLLGRHVQELVGRRYDDFVHPEERQQVADRRRLMAGTHTSVNQVQRRLIHSEGSTRWAQVLVTRIHEHDRYVTLLAFDDVTAEIEAKERLEHAALHDTLTGLPNRRLLTDRLEQALNRSRRSGCVTAVLFLDLDRVKQINDTHGHAVGDSLLEAIAQRLLACVRDQDTVARIGGDEFLIVCEGVGDPVDVRMLADRVLRDISAPLWIGGIELTVTASIGMATSTGDATGDELVRAADMAMYEAKSAGRDRLVVA
jgi:diguanylate cyclase (GGDEF)-like protein/PAS domain S-box-containing protein